MFNTSNTDLKMALFSFFSFSDESQGGIQLLLIAQR